MAGGRQQRHAARTLKVQFPEMVPEVPRSFPRAVQGMLPLIRLGWSMLRPPAS